MDFRLQGPDPKVKQWCIKKSKKELEQVGIIDEWQEIAKGIYIVSQIIPHLYPM